jgi:MFS family permease
MRATVINIGTLLMTAGVLAAGEGLLHTLLALRGAMEGFTYEELGILTTGYYMGFLCGCIMTPRLVKRTGHIRAYATLAAIAGAVALMQIFIVHSAAWFVMRIVFGLCIAGIYMVLESWLNDSTANDARGRVFATYRISALSGLTVGQLMLASFDPAGFELFAIVAIFISLSLVPIALTTSKAPIPMASVQIRPLHLFRDAPAGAYGCLVVGLVGGAYNGLAPVFASAAGLTTPQIALFMGFAVVGGALSAWPIGALSDRFDRRRVLAGVTAASALVGISFVLAASFAPRWIILLSFAYGASAWSIYAIAVAHTNDRIAAEAFVGIAAGLLVIFAVGAITGPILAAFVIGGAGPKGLFLFTAAVHTTYALYLALRITRQDPVPEGAVVPFEPVPATSPMVLEMDPRSDSEAPNQPDAT